MDDGADCTLSKFADDRKLGWETDRPGGHAAIQQDPEAGEMGWQEPHGVKKEVQSPVPGRNNPVHKYMLGDTQLESNSAEKDLVVLVAPCWP